MLDEMVTTEAVTSVTTIVSAWDRVVSLSDTGVKIASFTPTIVTSTFFSRLQELVNEQILGYDRRIEWIARTTLSISIGYDFLNADGKISKRVKSVLFKEHGIKISPDNMTTISELANRFKIGGRFAFDFTAEFNWNAGDFGDHGSCYWWENRRQLRLITTAGFRAIRFYNLDKDGAGCGRAWIAPLRGEPDKFIIFNAYGYDREIVSNTLIGWLGDGYYASDFNLLNMRNCCEPLYINGGKGTKIGRLPHDISPYDMRISS